MWVEDVARWFLEYGPLLNPVKTEAVLFGASTQQKKVLTASGIDLPWMAQSYRSITV